MITQVVVQTFTPGENINGTTLPVSKLEQGGTWRNWSSSKWIICSDLINRIYKKETFLVDDASTFSYLGAELDAYMRQFNQVKIVRILERAGQNGEGILSEVL